MKKLFKWFAISLIAFFAFVFVVALFSAKKSPKENAELLQQKINEVSTEFAQLSKLGAAIESASLTDGSSCNFPAGKNLTLHIIDINDLKKMDSLTDKISWSWMDSFVFRDGKFDRSALVSVRKMNDTLYTISNLKQTGFIGVIKTDRFVLPTYKDTAFSSGEFSGRLYIANLATLQAQCMISVHATNDTEVTYSTHGVFSKSASDALRANFKDNIRKALKESLGKIAPGVQLGGLDGNLPE